MKNDEKDYIFNFQEVRDLDATLSEFRNDIKNLRAEVKALSKKIDDRHRKQYIMPSNEHKKSFDWKTVGVVIGSILATIYAMVGS